ncbi:hypothetical protein HU200_059085 [Digitaria exilis]|uniref:Uncharacterized protein n=1 Tax=Digitaria exilis TaxID=1010633 RepID=A0A835AGR0_9POAL|nr:hypothetical protein HU200_059085 [Digitaria exilis]
MPFYQDTLDLRVFQDVEKRELQRTRLDLVCLHDVLFGAGAMDPATGRMLRINGYLDDPTALAVPRRLTCTRPSACSTSPSRSPR